VLAFGDVFPSPGGCYRHWQAPVCAAPSEDGSMAKLRILYGEGDGEILKAQAASIEKAGHTVQPAVGRKGVEEAIKQSAFDLVLLGPTLSRNDRHHLPYMVKKASAETSVLVMHADGSRHPYVDACTDTGEPGDGPDPHRRHEDRRDDAGRGGGACRKVATSLVLRGRLRGRPFLLAHREPETARITIDTSGTTSLPFPPAKERISSLEWVRVAIDPLVRLPVSSSFQIRLTGT